jgi:hypothetical protein
MKTSLDNLDLLQRSRTILDKIWRLNNEYNDRLNTLFDSGYITQTTYKNIRENDDISIISFYNIINNEHKEKL